MNEAIKQPCAERDRETELPEVEGHLAGRFGGDQRSQRGEDQKRRQGSQRGDQWCEGQRGQSEERQANRGGQERERQPGEQTSAEPQASRSEAGRKKWLAGNSEWRQSTLRK